MITPPSNKAPFIRSTKRFGDGAFLLFFSQTIWSLIFTYTGKQALQFLFVGLFQIQSYVISNTTAVLARKNWGSECMGLGTTCIGVCILVIANSAQLYTFTKPFCLILVPFSPIIYEGEEFYDFIFIKIRSRSMLCFTGLFVAVSLYRTIQIYIGRGNRDVTKRGESYLKEVFNRYTQFKVPSYWIEGFIEPMVIGLIGWGFYGAGDHTFGIYLWLSAGSTFKNQTLERAAQLRNRTMG